MKVSLAEAQNQETSAKTALEEVNADIQEILPKQSEIQQKADTIKTQVEETREVSDYAKGLENEAAKY